MTHDFRPDEDARRRERLFRHGWERVVFFGGLAACVLLVVISEFLRT